MTVQLTDEITLRPYDATRDADTVTAMAGDVWRGAGHEVVENKFGPVGGKPWRQWLSDDIRGYLAGADCRAFIAEMDGQAVGFCSYVIDAERSRGTVGYNAVAPNCQGRGLGSAMLKFVLAQIKAEGMQFAGVIVADNPEHEPARRMYERHGFEPMSANVFMMQKLDDPK